MKTIQNKTAKPIKIHLAGGKVLHLGPHKTGQVADNATEQPSLKRRIDAGEVSVLGEGGPAEGGFTDGLGKAVANGEAYFYQGKWYAVLEEDLNSEQ